MKTAPDSAIDEDLRSNAKREPGKRFFFAVSLPEPSDVEDLATEASFLPVSILHGNE
jgi:hypothetical protein